MQTLLIWSLIEIDVDEPDKVKLYQRIVFLHSLRPTYRISSPISLVIFSVLDTEICKIFHQKWGLAYSQGFGIKKKLLNSVVLLSSWTTRVCLKVSKY